MADLDVTAELTTQADMNMRQLRARLYGLTDEEYLWEPVEGSWNLRRASESAFSPGTGEWTIDLVFPAPDPAPVTTIAWRLNHILVSVLGVRIASHFGGAPIDYAHFEFPGHARDALALLDDFYAQWIAGVRSWSTEDLALPVGDTEPFLHPRVSRASLVLHINRELIHHGAEIALLRDLYLHRFAPQP